MQDNGIIFFSYCGVNPAIERDEEKWQHIRNLYPAAIIINADRTKINSNCRKVIQGVDIVIASEQTELISHEVREEVQIGLEYGLPVYVIRGSSNKWKFHEVNGVKDREVVDDILFMNELVLKDPDGQGYSNIDPKLLTKASDIFSTGQQEIKFNS